MQRLQSLRKVGGLDLSIFECELPSLMIFVEIYSFNLLNCGKKAEQIDAYSGGDEKVQRP